MLEYELKLKTITSHKMIESKLEKDDVLTHEMITNLNET